MGQFSAIGDSLTFTKPDALFEFSFCVRGTLFQINTDQRGKHIKGIFIDDVEQPFTAEISCHRFILGPGEHQVRIVFCQ